MYEFDIIISATSADEIILNKHNVSDAIIVFSKTGDIKIFNNAAEILFKKKKDDVLQIPIGELFNEQECKKLHELEIAIHQLTCVIASQKKYLLISRSNFHDADGAEYIILVMKDLTEQWQNWGNHRPRQ